MSDYPEHDKLQEVSNESQVCGEFLDWVLSGGRMLAVEHKHTDACYTNSDHPTWPDCDYQEGDLQWERVGVQELLAEFFDIDQGKIESEKRDMLSKLRRA